MPGSSYIISYLSDFSDVLSGARQVERINKEMSQTLSSDYVRATKVIGTSLDKVTEKPIKLKGGEEATQTITKLGTVIQTADGSFKEFTKTQTFIDGELQKTSGSLKDVTSNFRNTELSLGKLIEKQQDTSASMIKLVGASSQLGTNFNNTQDITNKFQKQLANFGQVSNVVSTSLGKVTDTSKQINTVVQTTDGKFIQLNETIKRMPNGLQTVSRSAKDVSQQFHVSTQASNNLNKSTVSLGENIGRLAKRALLTIPIWLALRGAILGTFRVISDGLKTIAEQDKALQKARRNIEATSKSQEELTKNFARLQKEALQLSLTSGKSIEEVTTAFQRFATVGFDTEVALIGMQYATKLAVAEFGDAVDTADAFARSLRVLIGESGDSETQQKQIAEALALTDQLWQNNAFEIKEFSNNLRNFSAVARVANISVNETIALLATLSTGGLANRAGRLLRTTVLKALRNIDEVSQKLKLSFNPATEGTFDFVLKLVDALDSLNKSRKIPTDMADILGDLFSVRSTEVVASLTALRRTLETNAKVVPDVIKLDETFTKVTETTGVLVDRFHNANREIGKALVTGLVGGESFDDSLKDIVETLEEMRKKAEDVGSAFQEFGQLAIRTPVGYIVGEFIELREKVAIEMAKVNALIVQGLQGELDLNQLQKLVLTLSKLEDISPFGGEQTLNQLTKQLSEQAQILRDELALALNQGLSKERLQALAKELETVDFNILGLDEESFNKVKQDVQTKLKELNNTIARETIKTQDIQLSLKKEQDIAKLILDIELDKLKAIGASNSELLKAESLYSAQLNIEEDTLDKVKRKLEYEKAINEERRLQNRLGSESIKLYDIAQTEGIDVAQRIGEVLSDESLFGNFVREGGRALEVFKDQFSDLYKQQQALAFYRGESIPGVSPFAQNALRGGFGIPIQEEAIRRPISQFTPSVTLAQSRATREFQRLDVNVQAPVAISVSVDPSNLEELENSVVDKIAKQIPQVGSKVNQAFAQALGNKQNRVI